MKKCYSSMLLIALSLALLLVIPGYSEKPSAGEPLALSLEVTEVELQKGKTLKLTPVLTGDDIPKKPAFKWQSLDKKVATVQSGTVKGISGGTTAITVSLKIDEKTTLTSSCEVTVIVLVSGVSTKDKAITINVGRTFSPKVTITPKTATNQALIWKSSNEQIVTVNEKGQIKAINSGECIITATTIDGSNKSLSITVFVPTLDSGTKEVIFDWMKQYMKPITVKVNYYTKQSNITLDDKDASNNWFFHEFQDGVLTIRIWPWQKGASTLTISDSSSPKSTLRIKITTTEESGLQSFEQLRESDYKEFMRYGVDPIAELGFSFKARVMQANNGAESTWVLAYSRGKYDDLVYFEFPTSAEKSHEWVKDKSVRIQEDDTIIVWGMLKDIFTYETTTGSTNHALKFRPLIVVFDDGTLIYVDKDILY